jgi:p-aminobenzoyl-glutamate transporter AbgT
MSYEERNAWVFAGVSILTGIYYLSTMLGGDPSVPLVARDWKTAMLTTIGGGIVVTIVLSIAVNIVFGIVSGDTKTTSDIRDRQINRFGDYVGHSFVIIGAVGALILLMLDMPSFWVAQAIFLGFFASGCLSSIARIASYRFGFSPW